MSAGAQPPAGGLSLSAPPILSPCFIALPA